MAEVLAPASTQERCVGEPAPYRRSARCDNFSTAASALRTTPASGRNAQALTGILIAPDRHITLGDYPCIRVLNVPFKGARGTCRPVTMSDQVAICGATPVGRQWADASNRPGDGDGQALAGAACFTFSFDRRRLHV